MKAEAARDIQLHGLTKKYMAEIGNKEEEIIEFFVETIEEVFGKAKGEQRKIEQDLIRQRATFYKKVFSQTIYTDDKLIIFLPLAHFGDATTESQRPYVKNKTSGQNVSFDISNEKLSGKEEFTSIEHDTVSDNYGKEYVNKYLTLKDNVNWSMHDLGHTILDSIYQNFSIIYFDENHPNEYPHEVFSYLFKDYEDFSGNRDIDGLESGAEGVNYTDALFIKKLLSELTPGVGAGDMEFSLFAKLIKNPSDQGIDNLIETISKNLISNLDRIHPRILKRFKIEEEMNSGMSTLKEWLKSILLIQKNVYERAHDAFKIIYVPKN